VGRVHIRASR